MFSLATIPRSSPIKVFTWEGTSKTTQSSSRLSFGHIALQIEAPGKITYISFWSGGANCQCPGINIRKKTGHFHTLRRDQEVLKKVANCTLQFFSNKIDTRKMIIKFEAYKELSEAGRLNYRLDTNLRFYGRGGKNCSTLILDLLEEGGIRQLAPKKIIENYGKFGLTVLYSVLLFLKMDFVQSGNKSLSLYLWNLGIVFFYNSSLSNIYTPQQMKELIIMAIKGDHKAVIKVDSGGVPCNACHLSLLKRQNKIARLVSPFPGAVNKIIYSLAAGCIGSVIAMPLKRANLFEKMNITNSDALVLVAADTCQGIVRIIHNYPQNNGMNIILGIKAVILFSMLFDRYYPKFSESHLYIACIAACAIFENGLWLDQMRKNIFG